jgi:hypothetical protein
MRHAPGPKSVLFAAVLLSAAATVSAQDHDACPMRAKMDHRAAVDHRHDAVSGVSHEAAVHHFLLTADGGTIRLETTDTAALADRDRIRRHLQAVARAFAAGDFAMPLQVHGRVPPGVKTLKKRRREITYSFSATERGGEMHLSTADPAALAAIHAFLRFQIEDHGTGDPIE